ncbi:MAG: DUF1553 domain-containing protein [Acidobacteria bacterium]|nr:DUF1553 domain-containing protein [Acidobacteriota bacterium]
MRLLLAFSTVCLAAPQFTILPAKVELNTPESRHQLLAEATENSTQSDWTRQSKWTSSNPQIATVSPAGLVTPIADGITTITVDHNGLKAQAIVTVRNAKAPFTWSFRNHVIPVMTKTGCNQGACHGALAGKNGFKLTLRGYDPDLDYDALIRQSSARRVSLAEPANSLVLLKPTFAIPHMGGLRIPPDSLEYRVIAEWIAAGAPSPKQTDPEIQNLEVHPANATLNPGDEQQLLVRARYNDGRIEDVTRWVKFTSTNEGVASVDDNGLVKMNGRGEAAITLWYSSKVLYARLSVPFEKTVSKTNYFRPGNFVDTLAQAKWQKLNLIPSERADDAAFLRRAYLDAIGVLPTAEEAEQFLSNTAPDKRAKLIEALLDRPEFTDYWAYKYSDLLLVSSRKLRTPAMWAFYNWIRDSVSTNKHWDQFARDIFTGTGNARQNGALNYFVLHKDVIELTENVTQAFLGQRLTCARCHNHPMEKWTQKQYYQMANLFARVGVKNGNTAAENIVFAKTAGDINHPRLLRPLNPTPLDGTPMPLDDTTDRRVHFANWLTNNNPYFTRNIVNRVWGNFFGRGLVHPVDDVRATNPASNEELFSAVCDDFVKHHYDLKHLIRTIMNSEVYQLSSDSNATNQRDEVFYSRYIVKRLPAEVLLDAMSQVTGVPASFPGYPAGTRALELPDVRVQSQFLAAFGRPERILCDAAERSSDPSITQALHVINGDTLNKKLSDPNGVVSLVLKLGLSDKKVLEHLYLSAFSRYPRPTELTEMTALLDKSKASKATRKEALEDLVWSLLTSKEFLFNY